jgi:adenine deaminase
LTNIQAGTNAWDMLAACRVLRAMRGGIVLVQDGRVTAKIDRPVARLISLKPAADVVAEVAAFRAVAEAAGQTGERAFTAIVSLTLTVSPKGKLSDLGLVDVERQTLLPTVIEPAQRGLAVPDVFTREPARCPTPRFLRR